LTDELEEAWRDSPGSCFNISKKGIPQKGKTPYIFKEWTSPRLAGDRRAEWFREEHYSQCLKNVGKTEDINFTVRVKIQKQRWDKKI